MLGKEALRERRAGLRSNGLSLALAGALVATATLVATAAEAAKPIPVHTPMLPLQSGNRWVYVANALPGVPAGTEAVVVGERILHDGRHISRVENYMFPLAADDVYFFTDRCARTCEVSPAVLGTAGPHPTTPLGGTWYACWEGLHSILPRPMWIPELRVDCVHGTGGHLAALGKPITAPAGFFPWSARIVYDSHACADSQLLEEVLVPDVGLVRRVVATFVGERVWSLCFAIVDGRVIGSPEACRTRQQQVKTSSLEPTIEPSSWGAIKSVFAD